MSTQKKNTTKKSKVYHAIIAPWRGMSKKELIRIISFFLVFSTISVVFVARSGFPSKKLIVVSLLISVLLTVILVYAQFRKLALEKIFLILAIPLGMLYFFLIPVGRVPDEMNHFYRAYEISNGNFVSTHDEEHGSGNDYSVKVGSVVFEEDRSYDDVVRALDIKEADTDDEKFVTYPNTSIYAPTCYFPQSLGMMIGNIFHTPILMKAYIGRLFNFATWVILVFFGIKKSPILKKVMLFVSLLPITLQQAASLSPDAINYGVAILLIGLVLYYAYSFKGKIRIKDWVVISVLCVVLSMCKYIYAPICLLLFLIPVEKFGDKKKKLKYIGFLALGIIALIGIWYLITRNLFVDKPGVDAVEQMKYILTNPFRIIAAIINTFFSTGQLIVGGLFGGYLEWFTIQAPFLTVIATIVAFCVLVYNYRRSSIPTNLKRLSVFIILSIVGISFIIEYLKWTPVGLGYVDGIQGRYYLPILFMVPFLFMIPDKKRKTLNVLTEKEDSNSHITLYQFILVVNVIALQAIFIHHITF